MNTRIAWIVALSLSLSACSSLSRLASFADAAPAEAPPPAAPPPPAQVQDDAWCQRVAASERERAQASGFDAATLDRMTLAAYQQCRILNGR